MHEFSIATGIVEAVSEFAEANPDKTVLKVRLQVGELTCVEAEQLKFCYESIVQKTSLENSTLEIEITPAAILCSHCHYEGKPRYWEEALVSAIPTLQCPQCGLAAEAIAGHECAIKTVQFLQSETESANFEL
ncbi:MAG: hydrogenase maturation nickel metallochaperone HypA [Verrucomicrobiota bacterium]